VRRRVELVFPEFRGRSIIAIDAGWDFDVFEVDREWIVRIPNRPEVEAWLATETAVLAELAPTFPVPVPRFELTRGTQGVAYRKLLGVPLTRARGTASIAAELGEALKALHAFPTSRAIELGAKDFGGGRFRAHYRNARWPQFRERVLPLLAPDEREQAERWARAYLEDSVAFRPALVHRDLGPEHVLVADGRVGGVIDWADARVADPAIDFAWLLHGLSAEFASALLDAYAEELDATFLERARFYHVLGPFYEVVHGQDTQQPALVDSGLAGIRQRLDRWPFSA
jgi:aminoglycoside phosphotransferase (APT) family kinase protein